MKSITVNRLANSGRDEKLLIISIFQLVSPSLRFQPGLKPPYNQPQIYFFIVKERNLHYGHLQRILLYFLCCNINVATFQYDIPLVTNIACIDSSSLLTCRLSWQISLTSTTKSLLTLVNCLTFSLNLWKLVCIPLTKKEFMYFFLKNVDGIPTNCLNRR